MDDFGDDDDLDDVHGDDAGRVEGDIYTVEIREQDRYLPIANIARIMKRVLPGNTKIAKDAKESIQSCVSEFISFITSEASDKCQLEKRKTINGDDLLWAMNTLGFDQYGAPLQVYLTKFRESVKGEKPDKSGKAAPSSMGKYSSSAQPKTSKGYEQKAANAAASAQNHYQQMQLQQQAHAAHMAAAQAASSSSTDSNGRRTTTVSVVDFLGINICELATSCITQQQSCEQAVGAGIATLSHILQQTPVDEATTATLQYHMRNFMELEYARQVTIMQQMAAQQQLEMAAAAQSKTDH